MRPCLSASLFALAALAASAWADDAPFISTDPTSIAVKGETDLQQWFTWGAGHTGEGYNSFESVTEFDYGLSDRLQLALMVVYDWSRVRPQASTAETQSQIGLAAEAIYVLLPAAQNPVGIALAIDPAFNSQSREFDARILLQKHIWGLNNVLNINFENAWEKDPAGQWTGTSGISFNLGIAYPLDEHWTAGIELGNEIGFNDLFTSERLRAESRTFFLGPTVQYDCEFAVLTISAQAQLPWSHGSTAIHGFTSDADRYHVGMRLSRAI